eukprot:UN29533
MSEMKQSKSLETLTFQTNGAISACNDIQKDLQKVNKEIAENLKKVKGLYTEFQNVSNTMTHVKKATKNTESHSDELNSTLTQLEKQIDKLKADLRPQQTRSGFMKLLIGNVNLKIWDEQNKTKFRAEYIEFREKAMIPYLAFPIICFIWPGSINSRFFT